MSSNAQPSSSGQSSSSSQAYSSSQPSTSSQPSSSGGSQSGKKKKGRKEAFPPPRGINYDSIEGKHKGKRYYFLEKSTEYEAVLFAIRKSYRRSNNEVIHTLKCTAKDCQGGARIIKNEMELDKTVLHVCLGVPVADRIAERVFQIAINEMKHLARTTTASFEVCEPR